MSWGRDESAGVQNTACHVGCCPWRWSQRATCGGTLLQVSCGQEYTANLSQSHAKNRPPLICLPLVDRFYSIIFCLLQDFGNIAGLQVTQTQLAPYTGRK